MSGTAGTEVRGELKGMTLGRVSNATRIITMSRLDDGQIVQASNEYDQLAIAFDLGELPQPDSMQARLFRAFLVQRRKLRC